MKKNRAIKFDTGENWIYSFADMMSLLLCFFIIFFSLAKKNRDNSEEVKRKIVETFTNNTTDKFRKTEHGVIDHDREIRALQLLVAAINLEEQQSGQTRASAGQADNLEPSDKPKDQTINKYQPTFSMVIPNDLLFASATDQLKPKAADNLKNIARKIMAVPDLVKVEVHGHTDSDKVWSGPFRDNWILSAARAASVAKTLIVVGLDKSVVGTMGHADTQPIESESGKTGVDLDQAKARNRRVEIIVVRRAQTWAH